MEDSRSVEQRLDSIDRLIADFEIEGFEFTSEELEELHQIALGNKTTERYRQELFDKIAQLKVTNPELFIGEDLK